MQNPAALLKQTSMKNFILVFCLFTFVNTFAQTDTAYALVRTAICSETEQIQPELFQKFGTPFISTSGDTTRYCKIKRGRVVESGVYLLGKITKKVCYTSDFKVQSICPANCAVAYFYPDRKKIKEKAELNDGLFYLDKEGEWVQDPTVYIFL